MQEDRFDVIRNSIDYRTPMVSWYVMEVDAFGAQDHDLLTKAKLTDELRGLGRVEVVAKLTELGFIATGPDHFEMQQRIDIPILGHRDGSKYVSRFPEMPNDIDFEERFLEARLRTIVKVNASGVDVIVAPESTDLYKIAKAAPYKFSLS